MSRHSKKDIDNKVVPKAKGFQDPEKDFVATDSSTWLRDTLRLLGTVSNQYQNSFSLR